MNSVSFFYNIFTKQELILKLNTIDFFKQFTLKKCIVFKSNTIENKDLQNVNNDLRYILEFLTNTKISKSINKNFSFKIVLNKNKSYDLFLYLTYLIFSRSNFLLESKVFEYGYPILQKSNKIKKLVSKKNKNYFDLRFRNGLSLPFLSDNEYVSFLTADFNLRFIFKNNLKKDLFLEIRQLIFISLIGLKFILIKKEYEKNI